MFLSFPYDLIGVTISDFETVLNSSLPRCTAALCAFVEANLGYIIIINAIVSQGYLG